jgi:hypothetical protein
LSVPAKKPLRARADFPIFIFKPKSARFCNAFSNADTSTALEGAITATVSPFINRFGLMIFLPFLELRLLLKPACVNKGSAAAPVKNSRLFITYQSIAR